MRHAACYLMAIDVGAWESSSHLMLPGQSADPESPHYADFYQPWINGDMQPMHFAPAEVDAACQTRYRILPAA